LFSDVELADAALEPAPSEPAKGKLLQALEVGIAVLAMISAIGGLVASRSANDSLRAKNDAILIRASASDGYTAYEARNTREQIFEAQIAANPRLPKNVHDALARVAEQERIAKAPLLDLARRQEAQAADAAERGDRFAHAYEVMEIGVALFEVSIAIVAVSALLSSPPLVALGGICAAGGIFFILYGYSFR
jgi:hypothetical protein